MIVPSNETLLCISKELDPYFLKPLYAATFFEFFSTVNFVSSIITIIASHDAQCPLPSL